MGRSEFENLRKLATQDRFMLHHQNLYLYGSSGSGKSHLLAALVCWFIKNQKRVVYIPDCAELVGAGAALTVFKKALRFCYNDDGVTLQTINDFLEFWGLAPQIILAVDQLNALDRGPSGISTRDLLMRSSLHL